jgi:hypothetical protein
VAALRDAALAVARDLSWLDPGAPPRSSRGVAGVTLGAYDDPRWVEFLRVMLAHPAFAALRTEPRLLAMLETILGAPAAPDAGDLLRVVSAGDPSHTTVAHQNGEGSESARRPAVRSRPSGNAGRPRRREAALAPRGTRRRRGG